MSLIWSLLKFIFYSGLIVIISKYVLVPVLRKLAESLNLKPRTVGNITGIATSVPELLTISFSAFAGLIYASIYNVISSNVINTLQYLMAVFLNKNQSHLYNRAIKIDLVMVVLTIIIPILLFIFNIDSSVNIVPAFILLFLLFGFINKNVHKLYLNKETVMEKEIKEEEKWVKGKKRIIVKNTLYLLIISVLLYFFGNLLSITLESLCIAFKVPEWLIGILLGFITSYQN